MAKWLFNRWLAVAILVVALLAAVRFAGCRQTSDTESFARSEAELLRARLQPPDGTPLTIRLTQSAWSAQAQWTYQTAQSWDDYLAAVEAELRRDFHVHARTPSTMEFTRETSGDAYHLRLERGPREPSMTITITLTITAD